LSIIENEIIHIVRQIAQWVLLEFRFM